jgi:hypothetical protein
LIADATSVIFAFAAMSIVIGSLPPAPSSNVSWLAAALWVHP